MVYLGTIQHVTCNHKRGAIVAAKKLEGLCENTRGSQAVFGFLDRNGEPKIDLIDFNWVARRGDRVVPIIQMVDGTDMPADQQDDFLGIEPGPIEKTSEAIADDWLDRIDRYNINLSVRDDDEDEDDDDDDDADEDEDDDDEPVRIRPRRR